MNAGYKNNSNVVFFDLETKRGAAQVGWSRISRMGMSLAVTHSERDGYQTFLHDQVQSLISYLMSADAVVGFNHIEFDYKVLSAYTDEDLGALHNIDMFLIVFNKTRRRISLNKLAQGSLGRSKSGDGCDALRWYEEGRIDLIEKYCREDVAITRDLYYRGCDKGFVSYLSRGQQIDVPVDWAYLPHDDEIVKVPSQKCLDMDFLQTICQMGPEFKLYDAIIEVGKNSGLLLDTNSSRELSITEAAMFQTLQDIATGLSHKKCLEPSRPGFWKITAKGIEMVRSSNGIQNQEGFDSRSEPGQSSGETSTDVKDRVFKAHFGFKSANSSGEPSTDPHSQSLVPDSLPEPEPPLPEDQDNKIQIPSPDQIRIPLLNAICEMGGKIQLGEAISSIEEHFNITLELQAGPLQTVRDRLIESMRQTAYMLKHEKCLEQLPLGYWKITAKGFTEPGITISINEDAAASNRSESVNSSRDASTDWKDRIFKKCFGSSTVNSFGEPSTDPHSQLLVPDSLPEPEPPLPEDQDNKIQVPSPDQIRIPLLLVINNMGGEIKLFDAAERIAAHFGMPLREFQQNRFSTVRNRLLEAMQQATLILSSDGCIERSRGLLWNITDKGVQELRRFNETDGQETRSANSDSLVDTLWQLPIKKPSNEREWGPPPQKRPRATVVNTKNFVTSKIVMPTGTQIKIALLRIIGEIGGRVEISQALPKIGLHFKIPVEQAVNGRLSQIATGLLEKMKYAAKLLWYDNYLELIQSNTWRITATGADFLESSGKNPGLGDFEWRSEAQIQSAKSAESIKQSPSEYSKKKFTVPSVAEIQIPLLQVIQQSMGQVSLQDLIQRLAEDFSIPGDQFGIKSFSKLEKRFHGAVQKATDILAINNYVTLLKPGYWTVTEKGLEKLRSLNLLRDEQPKPYETLNASQKESTVQGYPSEKISRQPATKTELANFRPKYKDHRIVTIPSPDLIRIPLLDIIYVMGGEIELFQATKGIAKHFDIPITELGEDPFSTIEKRLFEAMQNAAALLRTAGHVEKSRPDYWKITEKGLNWLKSSGKID